jgi:predicted regulator of Ras-like GTPase activity (Roadblock/LC7/MglB family)
MAMVEPAIANSLMLEIQRIENGTDLKRVSVISRTGMKIATSDSDQMDADAETASSAALIDLAERLSDSVTHGHLREILVKADSGFVILEFINEEYMVFGGISDPLRIGFYMEYLRNEAYKFAFILAGNKLTDELRKEIEAERDREKKLAEAAKAPLAADFKIDKSNTKDIEAMQGVLEFLNDWGDDSENKPASANNIVGIDDDMMFGMGDLAPEPITQSQISTAQNAVVEETADEGLPDDILAALDDIADNAGSPPAITSSEVPEVSDDVGLPDDILAALDDIAETASTMPKAKKKKTSSELPYGIPIYDEEVPPVPLEDYVSFEVGSLTAEETQEVVEEPEVAAQPKFAAAEDDPFAAELPVGADGTPDFSAMATSEYDDLDLDLEEDAMLQALEELGIDEKKKKQ